MLREPSSAVLDDHDGNQLTRVTRDKHWAMRNPIGVRRRENGTDGAETLSEEVVSQLGCHRGDSQTSVDHLGCASAIAAVRLQVSHSVEISQSIAAILRETGNHDDLQCSPTVRWLVEQGTICKVTTGRTWEARADRTHSPTTSYPPQFARSARAIRPSPTAPRGRPDRHSHGTLPKSRMLGPPCHSP
jgi:hypothetical protein